MLVLILLACRPPAPPDAPQDQDQPGHRWAPPRPRPEPMGHPDQPEGDAEDTAQPEALSGLAVAMLGLEGDTSTILSTDLSGVVSAELHLADGCRPMLLVSAGEGEGWVAASGSGVVGSSVVHVGPDGSCTTLAELPDGVYGLARDPAGGYLAASLDTLIHVDLDGQVSTLAQWSADYQDPSAFEIVGPSIAVQPDGTVGLFDILGGFATWTPDDGLQVAQRADPEDQDLLTMDGIALDGAWIALALDLEGGHGLYAWDQGWTLVQGWGEPAWVPVHLAAGAEGEVYVTSTAGSRGRVWRLRDGEQDLILDTGVDAGRTMAGIAGVWIE